jgi:hypothetical protein
MFKDTLSEEELFDDGWFMLALFFLCQTLSLSSIQQGTVQSKHKE